MTTTDTAKCRACGDVRPLPELVRVTDTRTGETWHACRPSNGERARTVSCFREAVPGGPRFVIREAVR